MEPRARAVLLARGYQPEEHQARQFAAEDFADFDLVLAMDAGHLDELRQLAERADDPAEARTKIRRLREYDPAAVAIEELDVADPYYGDTTDYEAALDTIEPAVAGLVAVLSEIAHPNSGIR